MSKFFQKAKSNQAYFKVGNYGKSGSGKTLTSLLWAEGLAKREKKRIAYIDTERGTDFYSQAIAERTVHPAAFDFDCFYTRSMMETLEAVESLDPEVHGVLVIDSITHLWEAAMNAYSGPRMKNGGIPIQAWGPIKKPYKKLMTAFLDGNFHAIVCGREGVVMETNEDGEAQVVGTKMKAEGETSYEPHILFRFHPAFAPDGTHIIQAMVEKDRSGILHGKLIEWPNYGTIEPIVAYLSGGEQAKMGNTDDVAERDAAAQERQKEQEEADRRALYESIKKALREAGDMTKLKAAWDLSKGKKTKLGEDNYSNLATLKESKKAEILEAAEVA